MSPITASTLDQTPAWQALQAHAPTLRTRHLRELFATAPQRGQRLALDEVGIYHDYSKNRVTDETLRLLRTMAEATGLDPYLESNVGEVPLGRLASEAQRGNQFSQSRPGAWAERA